VSIRGFSLGKLEFPLAGFQGRSAEDLTSILADITGSLGQPSERQDVIAYVKELREAESRMAYKSLEVRPFVQESFLQFEIENKGNTDIELLMLEALVPPQFLNPNWKPTASPDLHVERKRRVDEEYWWFATTSQRGAFGRVSAGLRPIITPAMGSVIAYGMKLPVLQGDPPFYERHRVIYYQVHAADYPTEMETITWDNLEFRTWIEPGHA
jgi:hypothetical protein